MAQGTVEKAEEGTLPAGKSGKLQQAAFLCGSQSFVVFFFCNGLAAFSARFEEIRGPPQGGTSFLQFYKGTRQRGFYSDRPLSSGVFPSVDTEEAIEGPP